MDKIHAHSEYLLHLADNSLILGHRNSEWTGHGPILEQDIALSNIALDLIGQARHFYQYAADLIGTETGIDTDEDKLAYLRDGHDFKNCLLVEQPNGHWGNTVLRQFLFSSYQYLLYQQLLGSKDKTIAAIAEKSLKEITYHLRWSSEWVIRLGDGTEESHEKMKNALTTLWRFTDELFAPASYEIAVEAAGIGISPIDLKAKWMEMVQQILTEALLFQYLETIDPRSALTGGKTGIHTEHLGYILSEMQFLQRAYPGCEW